MSDHLYGVKQASKTKVKPISSSNALSFSSNLSALISKSSSGAATANTRPRFSKSGSDIFSTHNKNVKKRAAADAFGGGEQRHKTKDDIGSTDAVLLQRSKRRMEEKARLYQAMKRGEYLRRDGDDRGLVDFDRKWAEQEARGGQDSESDMTGSDDPDTEEIEYTDEFGRTRKGTRHDVEKEERRKRILENARQDAEQFAARPQMPSNVIYGDTVQHQAFNPDQVITERMAEIAKKRDRSATPPPDSHYDAAAEVRTKGTGFYTFSGDAEGRKKEMDELDKQRLETERIRKEREEKKEARKKDIEARRKAIAEQRSRVEADRFLHELDVPDFDNPGHGG